MTDRPKIEDTKNLMAALVRQPPKLHEEMKVGKSAAKQGLVKKEKKAKRKDGS